MARECPRFLLSVDGNVTSLVIDPVLNSRIPVNLVQREGKVKSVPVPHLPLREDILYLNCLCALFLNDIVTNNGFHSICNYNIAVIIKFLRNVDVLTILNSSSSFDLSRDCNQLSTLNLEANILRINLIRQKSFPPGAIFSGIWL